MVLVIWDLEVSKTQFLFENYGRKLYSPYLPSKSITRPKTILSAAWKIHGEDKIHVASVKPSDVFNDEGIIRLLHPVLQQATYLVGHNNDAFDLKEFNARALYYGLDPIDKTPKDCIDTLKLCRKWFRLDANDLRYVADFLNLAPKDDSPDWDAVHKGCPEAIRYMRQYNKQDVITLEQVYEKLRGWDNRPSIDIGAHIDERDEEGKRVIRCDKCGSDKWIKRGTKPNSKNTKYKEYGQCKCCGKQFQISGWIHVLKMPPKKKTLLDIYKSYKGSEYAKD